MGGHAVIVEYRGLYIFLEGGWGVSTGGNILGGGGISGCALGSLVGIVVSFRGGCQFFPRLGLVSGRFASLVLM